MAGAIIGRAATSYMLLAGVTSQPLTHARILIDTLATKANVSSATGASAGYPSDAVTNPLTFEAWKPVGDIQFDNGASRKADGLGIAAHTLGSTGTLVQLYSRGASADPWDLEVELVPGNDDPFLVLFDEKDRAQWRLLFTPPAGEEPQVAVVYIGQTLPMPRPIYGGHSPLALSRITALRPTISEAGQWLGRSIVRKGLATEFAWRHLQPDWYRSTFDPLFVAPARRRPFFIGWRPETYPDEVGYCWTTGDIKPSNMGLAGLMEVTVPVEALDVAAEAGV